jgi:hypothetical protein
VGNVVYSPQHQTDPPNGYPSCTVFDVIQYQSIEEKLSC